MSNHTEKQDLGQRTRLYAIRIAKLYRALPKTFDAQTMGKQVFRSGTSVGANYHEACFAKSDADFISKIETVLQELNEAKYWLQSITALDYFDEARVEPLKQETRELTAIFVSIVVKVKQKRK